ncbi:hypothetical protein METHPM2_620012 [Pseudomonas sp. PM2]
MHLHIRLAMAIGTGARLTLWVQVGACLAAVGFAVALMTCVIGRLAGAAWAGAGQTLSCRVHKSSEYAVMGER